MSINAGMDRVTSGLVQSLAPGAIKAREYLDTWMCAILQKMTEIQDSIDALDTREDTVRRVTTGQTAANGTLELRIPGPRIGFQWKLQRVSIVVRGGANTSAVVYLGNVSDSGVLLVIADADFYAGAGEDSLVPGGNDVVIAFTGAPATTQVTAIVQAVENRKTPADE